MSSSTPALLLESVRFRYAERDPFVVEDVDLEVERGATVCLWGPSGSGKSTLLALIGGVVSPTAGRVLVAPDLGGARGTRAWVMQTANLFGSMTAFENVRMGAMAAGVRPAATAAWQALDAVGIGELAHARGKRLSGGQAQRVAVARALASRPGLVLADEPTGQLDASSTIQVCDALLGPAGLGGTGATVIVASHDVAVAERCAIVVRLRDGRVL